MRAGAQDYVLKESLARLVPAIERELRDCETRRLRVQAEASLQRSEAYYRATFEGSPFPKFLMDQETLDILAVNDATVLNYG